MFNMHSRGLRTTFLATSMLTLGARVSYAQESSETVVVTGTRLATEGFVAPTPVTSVGAAEISTRAPGDIADVLNQIPSFRQTIGNNQAPKNNMNGQNTLDLRGLGINRTLVLVDSNRFVPTNANGSIDVNAIPVLLIQNIDVVTGGASAQYGSDAVAGVVNFILKDRMDGITGNTSYGISQQGDNMESTFNIAGGTNFFNDRLHIVGSVEYNNNKGVGNKYSRPDQFGNQQACLFAPTAAQRTAGNLPSQMYANDCTWSQQAASTVVLSGKTASGATSTAISNLTFGPGGSVLPFNVGTISSAVMYGGAPNPTDPHASPTGSLTLEAPHKRVNLYEKMTFDITDDISAWAQLSWSDNQAFSVTTYIQNTGIIVPITGPFANPYVPASLQSAATAAGLTALVVGRQEEAGGGQEYSESDIIGRAAFGLKGKIFGDWSWDVFYTHGETSNKTPLINGILEANYIQSIFAVAGPGGVPVCGPLASNPNFATGGTVAGRQAQVSSGCQPYNIFGPTIGVYHTGEKCFGCDNVNQSLINNPTGSQAAADYFMHDTPAGSHYQQDDFALNLRGTPFATWAGPVAMAVGFEHRREGDRNFTDAQTIGLYSNNNDGSAYSGNFDVNEGYIEANVPLLKDVPFVESLNADIAFREAGYSLFGVLPTYKIGVNWQINDDVRIRATRSRDVREPSIQDLFAATTFGINASFTNPVTHITGTEYTQGGGNPNLKPENADSTVVGVVYSPSDGWFAGLNASIDWFDVSIQKVITTQTPVLIVQACGQGNLTYCSLVLPGAGPGGTLIVQSTPANLAVQKTNGMDFEFSYATPLDGLDLPGDLTIRWLTTWTDINATQGLTYLDVAGSGSGSANWVSSINFTYALGPSATNIQMRYTSDILADPTLIGPGQNGYSPTLSNSVNINQFPSSYYFDFSENYDFYNSDRLKLTAFLNINNILDKQPPLGDTAFVAFVGGGDPYDLIGRTFKVGLRFKY